MNFLPRLTKLRSVLFDDCQNIADLWLLEAVVITNTDIFACAVKVHNKSAALAKTCTKAKRLGF